jgi:hypothetical protein
MARLIDGDRLFDIIEGNVPAPYEDSREAKEECLSIISEALTVDAVPIPKLIELRDRLNEDCLITMRGLHDLNMLIAKYEGGKDHALD